MRALGRLSVALLLGGLVSWPAYTLAAGTPLIDAVKRQDQSAVRTLLRQKIDVNAAETDGATALHWAASRNDVAIAQLLVKGGAKVDPLNEYGVTPLSLALENGSTAMTTLLLGAGANANLALPTGETPLMTASRTGNLDTVKALLDKGADANAAEPEQQQTALMWALSERHNAIAQLLVERGANVNARTKAGEIGGVYAFAGKTQFGGFTPLMFAVRHNNQDAVKMLLAKGAALNDTANDGVTPLMVAVLRGHAPLAQWLLEQGADPNIDKAGYTALHWAAGKWESGMTHDYPTTQEAEWRYLVGVPQGKIDLIKALLKHGAHIEAPITRKPPRFGINLFNAIRVDGGTPFWIAALSADVEVMKLLKEMGAKTNVPNKDGVTPLMAAAGLGRVPGDSLITDEEALEAVKLLVDWGGNDLNAANASGDTALHGTAYYGNDKVAEYLVSKGANLNPKNKKGETPLKVANGYSANAMILTRPAVATVLKKLGATE